MSSLKTKKTIKTKKSGVVKTRVVGPRLVEHLPVEMLTEIVARVGATSPTDLFRCKRVCKIIHEIAEEKTVLKQVAIHGVSTWRSHEKAEYFFKKCRDCNNPNALYRLGMIQYFSQFMAVEGLVNLEKAAAQRHKDAIYALALVLVCSGDDQCRNRGVELLLSLMDAVKGKGIVELRLKLREFMLTLQWLRLDTNRDSLVTVHPEIVCTMGRLHEIKSRWDKECYYNDKVEDKVVCAACKCGREVAFFLDLVKDV